MSLIDLTGKRFGMLVVLHRTERPEGVKTGTFWLCQCDCKSDPVAVRAGNIKKQHSCGCYRNLMASTRQKKYNEYNLSGEYGIGYTLKGEEFYFDLEDYDKIKDYCWYMHQDNYLSTNIPGYYHPRLEVLMHRMILGLEDPSIQVDHIDRHRNDNRKFNLRIASPKQNSRNRTRPSNNSSGVMGVCWSDRSGKYRAYITYNHRWITLGEFGDMEDAIKARLKAELEYFGLEFSSQRHLFKEYGII